MGQEAVFKLSANWELLICALGGALLLKLIRISLQEEKQDSRKLENE